MSCLHESLQWGHKMKGWALCLWHCVNVSPLMSLHGMLACSPSDTSSFRSDRQHAEPLADRDGETCEGDKGHRAYAFLDLWSFCPMAPSAPDNRVLGAYVSQDLERSWYGLISFFFPMSLSLFATCYTKRTRPY